VYLGEMELSTFITETLKDIIKGIKYSQEFAKDNEARVNPFRPTGPRDRIITYGTEDGYRALTTITFDIAVTASNQQETGVNGGVSVWGINIGGKQSDSEINQTVSRIKFDLGVVLPSVQP
jgi:hypothetical protein